MLSNAPVTPVLPAEDLARAKNFYSQKLGLQIVMENEGAVIFAAGNGTQLVVYPYGRSTSGHTAAGFQVDDLAQTMNELRNNGVVFEEYDLPGIKTVDGVAEMGGQKGAWVKDTEGNVIGLVQM